MRFYTILNLIIDIEIYNLQVAERMNSACVTTLKQLGIDSNLIIEEHFREEPSKSIGDGTGIM